MAVATTPHQPGSAFKPVIYAAAVESRKFTAASILNDAPDVYDRWKPQNYEKENFKGRVRLRTALAESINTVAIRPRVSGYVSAVRFVAFSASVAPVFDAL